jgi:predicted Zn-dependent peptidase
MKIKIVFSAILLASSAIALQAQDAVTEMTVNGLKVIFKPSSKQTVSAVMFFRGGTANYDQKQQGIESLALNAVSECGTAKYDKDAFKDMSDKYGIDINGTAGFDYGTIGMSCVKPYFTKGWELFAEAVNHPVFEEKELGLLKQKLLSALRNQESNPDNALNKMCIADAFKDTRYASRPEGTVETIGAFTQADVKAYYDRLLNVNRMLLVVVGNLQVSDVKKLAEEAFGKLPSTAVAPVAAPVETRIAANSLNIENRKLATNYIQGILGAPSPVSSEFNAYRIAVSILSEKLFQEVRTKRNLSYAPYSFVSSGFIPFSAVYVTTTKPKDAVTVMVDEIKRLRDGGFTETDLRDAKSKFATSYFMKNESSYNIAQSLGIAEIKGSWKNETTFLDKINAVTLPEMQKIFAAYAGGIRWNYLGVDTQVDKDAFDKTTK